MAEEESIPVEFTAAQQSMEKEGFFPEEWAPRVKQILCQETDESRSTNKMQLFRVPKALLSGNPQAYIPQLISLGPYHHHHFKYEEQDQVMKMSTQEAYKVKSAAILSQRITKYGESWNDLFGMIIKRLTEIGTFYQLQMTGGNQYADNFTLMIMVDTFFLIYFMYSLLDRPDYLENGEVVKCDILKLENQLPLFVLKEVYENVKRVLFPGGFDDYHYLLRNTCLELSPIFFYYQRGVEESELHLLGFIHANVAPHLELEFVQPPNTNPTLRRRMSRYVDHYVAEKICSILFCFNRPTPREPLIKKYNAAELEKAGIKFDTTYRVWFDKYSRTLYFPLMKILSVQTEVFFRNLVALEFLDAHRRKSVTQFIQLMDCLIDTPEDVHVLKKCGVFSAQSTLSEEHIAKMWDSICQSSRGPEEPSVKQLKEELQELVMKNYCRPISIIAY